MKNAGIAKKNTKATLILPCAGYGTRAGSPPAKELLPHPRYRTPMIDRALRLAKRLQWPLVIITRPEKKTLIDYVTDVALKNPQLQVQWVLARKTAEWPESVLLSQTYWAEKNLVITPDTEWEPDGIEEELCLSLDTYDVCYGTFITKEIKTWGAVELRQKHIRVCEPPNDASKDFRAWGLLAFRRAVGPLLFQTLLESALDHQIKVVPLEAHQISLRKFSQLTRPL